MHKDVSAGQQLAGRIIDIDFDKQRTRSDVNGVGVAYESAMEGLAREFIEGNVAGAPERAAREYTSGTET